MRKKKKNKQTNQIREEALYIREGEEPRENIREKEEPREKKKNKQTNQIREEALYIREGEEPRGKKKIRNRKREKIETRVGGFEVSAWDHGWVGWLQIRVGHAAARARTWVACGPGSHAVVRWSGSGVVWLD